MDRLFFVKPHHSAVTGWTSVAREQVIVLERGRAVDMYPVGKSFSGAANRGANGEADSAGRLINSLGKLMGGQSDTARGFLQKEAITRAWRTAGEDRQDTAIRAVECVVRGADFAWHRPASAAERTALRRDLGLAASDPCDMLVLRHDRRAPIEALAFVKGDEIEFRTIDTEPSPEAIESLHAALNIGLAPVQAMAC